MLHIREMINNNNKDKELRYIIIAMVGDVRTTVHAPMSLGRDEARADCIEQLGGE